MKALKKTFALASIILLVGCTINVPPNLPYHEENRVIDEKVDLIQIGMDNSEVRNALGPPTHVKTTLTADGTVELWEYCPRTLAVNLLSKGQRFRFGWNSRENNMDVLSPAVLITLTDGYVTMIEK
jgi:hypothetical protein